MALIALVDDDVDFAHLVAELLEDRGWAAVMCHNEAEARRCVEESRPDLVILDLRLDHRDSGWRVLQELRDDPETRGIPVIVCSAAVDDLQRRAGWLAERGIPTLPKPFDIDDMLTLVERSLGGAADPKGNPDPHRGQDGRRGGSS